MSFESFSFVVAGHAVDALGDALIAAGALCVDVADADSGTEHERAAFDEPGNVVQPWRRSRLNVLFGADGTGEAVVAAACRAVGVNIPDRLERATIDDQDWVRLSRSQFRPIRISPRLWIVPTWETAPDPDAINLVLDPGAAFGTGSHATTRLCLQWLCESLAGGEHVLDYGCGSGILAIAALHLGAGHAHGVDIDPQAVLAARANAMQNRVAAEFSTPGSESGIRYHVVIANILANPLIALAPLLARATLPGGRIVLSGILQAQAAEVANVYSSWFEMDAARIEEGWALLVGHRPAESSA